MTEVEKMYENAGIKKEVIPCPAKYYGYDCTRNNWDDEDCSCDIEDYPPFTSEKQLELIKWLAIKGDFEYTVDIAKNTDAYWTIYFDDSRWTAREFEESLAGLINDLWKKLTEEERKQIKEILE